MNLTDMSFSERVKYVRAKIGLSQHGLAHELDMSYATISRWENESREPRLKTKARFYSFCRAHSIIFEDVPPYLLVDYIPEKNRPDRKDRRKARYKSKDEA